MDSIKQTRIFEKWNNRGDYYIGLFGHNIKNHILFLKVFFWKNSQINRRGATVIRYLKVRQSKYEIARTHFCIHVFSLKTRSLNLKCCLHAFYKYNSNRSCQICVAPYLVQFERFRCNSEWLFYNSVWWLWSINQ